MYILYANGLVDNGPTQNITPLFVIVLFKPTLKHMEEFDGIRNILYS